MRELLLEGDLPSVKGPAVPEIHPEEREHSTLDYDSLQVSPDWVALLERHAGGLSPLTLAWAIAKEAGPAMCWNKTRA